MRQSDSINELALALSQFQGEVSNIYKDKKGYGYKYADLASILDMVRPLLAKFGLSLIQLPSDSNTQDWVSLETMLMHSGGQYISSNFTIPVSAGKGMSQAQAFGSVITYARRYALCSALGIASSDDDNDAASRPSQENQNDDGTPYDRLRSFFNKTGVEPSRETFQAWKDHFKIESITHLSSPQVDAIINKYKANQNV